MDIILAKAQIAKDFAGAYSLNDDAHQADHFNRVEACGNKLNAVLKLGYDPKLITLVAYFHDMFSWSRFNHHDLSGVFIDTTEYELIKQLSKEERKLVADGCREHRASRPIELGFTSEFSRMMNCADREEPTSAEAMIQRAMKGRLSRGATQTEARESAIAHIKEKYASGGYYLYDPMYLEVYGNEIEVILTDINQL